MPKDMQTEQLLCWSGMTDTEHSTTSSSNEEEASLDLKFQPEKYWRQNVTFVSVVRPTRPTYEPW